MVLFVPILFASLFVTKLISSPLVPVFENLDGSEAPVDYIGQVCTLTLPASSTQMGQAEVNLENNHHLLINVKLEKDKSNPILKGEEALIVGAGEAGNYYLIKKLKDIT